MGSIFIVKFVANSTTELYRYKLGNFKRLQYNINTPVSPMPLPEEDSNENVLIKIEGNSSDITLNWIVKDNNGVNLETKFDAPTGFPSSTVREQIEFIRKEFRPKSIADSYQLILRLDNADTSQDITFDGTFAQFGFGMADPELLTFKAQAKFFEGNVALGFAVDVSSEPLNLVVTSPASGEIDADWDVPQDPGTSALTLYRVHYRKFGTSDPFLFTDVSGTPPVTFLDDISSGGLDNEVYEVAVVPFTVLGFGKPSKLKNVVVQA